MLVAVLALTWAVGFRGRRAVGEPSLAGDAILDDIAGLYVSEKDGSQIDLWADATVSSLDQPSALKPLAGGLGGVKCEVKGGAVRVIIPSTEAQSKFGDITVKDNVLVSSTRGRYVRQRRWGVPSPGDLAAAVRPGQARPANHQPDECPESIAVSRDGSTAAAIYREGTTWVWDPKTGKSIGGWENNFRAKLALSPDGQRLTLASHVGRVFRMMNPRTGEFLSACVPNPGSEDKLTFSPDGRVLFSQGHLLDGLTGVEQRHIEVDAGKQDIEPYAFALLPNGAACLISGGEVISLNNPPWDVRFTLQWWNLRTGSLDRKLVLSESSVWYHQLVMSGDGKTVALRVEDQPGRRKPFIELRDSGSGQVIGGLQATSFSRYDGQDEHFAFTNEDKTLTILKRNPRRTAARMEEWDVATHAQLRAQQVNLPQISNEAAMPVFSAAANRLIYPAPGIGITFLDLTTWKWVPSEPAKEKPARR